ncbi:MAG: DNA polymerase Y family protein [Pseudomonadota bacterium]|nr:DNA polymerase Y family protein [Pseudomonadota bacterium]
MPIRFAITTGGHHPRIVIANEAATSQGIARQQLVSAALALAPDMVLRERDPRGELEALSSIAAALIQFTPTVSIAAPQAVLADIGGSLRLFGGLRALLRQIVEHLQALGYRVRTACAPTPAAAHFLVRAGQCAVITEAVDLEPALAPLPLALLDADAGVVQLLRAAGITTFGQACKLPREALARRVGKPFITLLDRTCGVAPDPRLPFATPARYRGRLELPVPVADVDALGFAVNRLVHELAGWLLGRGLGVNAVVLTLEHERHARTVPPATRSREASLQPKGRVSKATLQTKVDTGHPTSGATRVEFALASPARDPAHLMAVLRERLARVELRAAVEAVVLESKTTARLQGRTLALLPGEPDAAAIPLLDRLRARLGEHAVTCVTPLDDHRPERAWQQATATTEIMDHAPTTHASRVPDAARPLWLLVDAQPLGATFEAKPWILRDGPERIESGWWDGGDIRRDYYLAESPRGELLWIYRDSAHAPDGEWFLHGIFA